MRSLRSSLNETPRMSGSPAMSLPMSDAITTAMSPSCCRILRYRPVRMKRLRSLFAACATSCLLLLVLVPVALASAPNGGQGTYGEADDKVVTNAGFIVIAFFPTLILLLSLLQWRLDKRRDARKAAAKRRGASADWSGGW